MHIPVLLQEVIDGLHLHSGTHVIDGTLGAGGHAQAILEMTGPSGILVGFDRDQGSLKGATDRLQLFGDRFIPIHDSYATVGEHTSVLQRVQPIGGMLIDLGLSSIQLDSEERGFSFRFPEGRLDMKFDENSDSETAAQVLNTRTEEELAILFYKYGEVRRSRQLARAIVQRREEQLFQTVGDLVEVVEKTVPRRRKRKGTGANPSTTVFQALRIATNQELDQLEKFLPIAVDLLAPGGRFAVITFHSLEDRIVKQFFRDAAKDCVCPPEFLECRCDHRSTVTLITRKPIIPSEEEIQANPRSRSAKLRIVEKNNVCLD